jgi:hypothetical protein
MWCVIYSLFERPVAATVSSLQMLGEDLPIATTIDAMISRATHILSRNVVGQHASARLTHNSRAEAEQIKGRTI